MNPLFSISNTISIIAVILILLVFFFNQQVDIKNKEQINSEHFLPKSVTKYFQKITNSFCENQYITLLRETAYMLSIIYSFFLICLVTIPVFILLIWLGYTIYSCYLSTSSTSTIA